VLQLPDRNQLPLLQYRCQPKAKVALTGKQLLDAFAPQLDSPWLSARSESAASAHRPY
jgi:hypothetical protein